MPLSFSAFVAEKLKAEKFALLDIGCSGGIDSLWQTDRLVSRQPILECMAAMAALAGRTRRLRFGMNVVSLALRDPILLAKQCATIDVLSEGRLLPAFGVVGALLLVIAAVCAALAASRLKRPPRPFPTLTSRLRVAIKSNPLKPDQIDAARDTAAAILLAPSAPVTGTGRQPLKSRRRSARNNREVQAGLIVAATLLGWAVTRRQRQARRTQV